MLLRSCEDAQCTMQVEETDIACKTFKIFQLLFLFSGHIFSILSVLQPALCPLDLRNIGSAGLIKRCVRLSDDSAVWVCVARQTNDDMNTDPRRP